MVGQIMLLNRAAERAFGYAPDEVLGQPVELLLREPSLPDELG
jgi:PAS domain S-box-containing protein